jgi:hypothetical protein
MLAGPAQAVISHHWPVEQTFATLLDDQNTSHLATSPGLRRHAGRDLTAGRAFLPTARESQKPLLGFAVGWRTRGACWAGRSAPRQLRQRACSLDGTVRTNWAQVKENAMKRVSSVAYILSLALAGSAWSDPRDDDDKAEAKNLLPREQD